MNKIIIMLLLILSVSCSKKNEIESIFIADQNEYWQDYDYCYNTGGNCYKFKKNGTCDLYMMFSSDKPFFRLLNHDDDVINDPEPWSVKNDSTLLWNEGVYKIEKLSRREILLSYYHYDIKGRKCFVRLVKWVETPQGPRPADSLDKIR